MAFWLSLFEIDFPEPPVHPGQSDFPKVGGFAFHTGLPFRLSALVRFRFQVYSVLRYTLSLFPVSTVPLSVCIRQFRELLCLFQLS